MEDFLWVIIIVSPRNITKVHAILPHGENVEDEKSSGKQRSGQLP